MGSIWLYWILQLHLTYCICIVASLVALGIFLLLFLWICFLSPWHSHLSQIPINSDIFSFHTVPKFLQIFSILIFFFSNCIISNSLTSCSPLLSSLICSALNSTLKQSTFHLMCFKNFCLIYFCHLYLSVKSFRLFLWILLKFSIEFL